MLTLYLSFDLINDLNLTFVPFLTLDPMLRRLQLLCISYKILSYLGLEFLPSLCSFALDATATQSPLIDQGSHNNRSLKLVNPVIKPCCARS